jgi:acyl carrier protein
MIAGVLGIDESKLNDASGMNETENWDSMNQFLIMTEIEQTLNIKFSFTELERAKNIAQIRAMLHEQSVNVAD